MCWMRDPEDYPFLPKTKEKVLRLIDDDKNCYAIVPQDYLFRHHIMIVHKVHRDNFIDCNSSEIAQMGKMMNKWCKIFKKMKYDTVYTGCFSDSGQVHFNLYPFNFEDEKIYRGNAIQWLAEKERLAGKHRYDTLEGELKEKRIKEIEVIVKELLENKNHISR